MPRDNSTPKPPSYRLHKASQQAVVTIKGKDHYLGPWMSPESRLKYERLITALLSGEDPATQRRSLPGRCHHRGTLRRVPAEPRRKALRQRRAPTSELTNVKRAIRCMITLYAALPVKLFSPLKLKACRDRLIQDGLCRSNVNRYQSIITRIVAYGVENEMVSGEVWHSLRAVKPLQRDRSGARETEPIGPVSESDVNATLPFLNEPYRTMVRLQGLLGCRPGELTSMTGEGIDRSEAVWIYRPRSHKTQHHGKERVIPIGPQAQLLLRPFLDSVLPAIQLFRNNRRTRISRNSYERAIETACRKAGIEPWSPNQLRHAAATRIRRQYGLEAAQVVLGHSTASTTEIYAERNIGLACDIASKLG